MRTRSLLSLLFAVPLAGAACGSVNSGDDPADARVSGGEDGGDDPNDAAPEVRCPEGMAYIPGGTYEMADLAGDQTVEPFCMDITHVTSSAYDDCVSCSATNTTAECNSGVANRTQDPANCLDLAQAVFYCESIDKFVPTEVQWEWAARGGEAANTWAWGDDPPVEDDDRLCWFFGRDDQTFPDRPSGSCPVGFYDQKDTQPFGLEDMTGNVWTWTVSEGSTVDNRVVRGGGWDNTLPNRMRTGFRNDVIPADIRDQHLGFRCAAEPL